MQFEDSIKLNIIIDTDILSIENAIRAELISENGIENDEIISK